MKTDLTRTTLFSLFTIILLIGFSYTASLSAADNKSYLNNLDVYKKLANEVISELDAGNISSIDKLKAMQLKLVQLGSDACRDYAVTRPHDAKLMNLVSNNAASMKDLSLNDMQQLWHENAYLKEQGIDIGKQSTVTRGLMDTVIHPATAYLALNEYKQSQDKKFLEQARAEIMKSLNYLETIQR